ncbi:MAG: septum formation initiator family protein [Tepidiformaceae bacterium]
MGILLHSRARLLFLGCLIVAAYFVYTAVSGAIQTHKLTQERDEAAAQVTLLQDKKVYLQAVKQYVASDAYVEQQARRQLGYIRDGEIPFVVTSPPPANEATPTGDWWQRLFPK